MVRESVFRGDALQGYVGGQHVRYDMAEGGNQDRDITSHSLLLSSDRCYQRPPTDGKSSSNDGM